MPVHTMDLISFLIGALVGLAIGVALWLAERRTAAARLAAIDEAQVRLRDAFAALSADALQRNNQMFLDLARTKLGEFQAQARTDLDARRQAIDDTLKPVQESLARVDTQIRDVERTRAGAQAKLSEQIDALARAQGALEAETRGLRTALRSPNVRGSWGEMQLRRAVEAAGMVEYCDFDEKPSVTTEEGRRTPDVVVKLPGGRQIIVDAKVPLEAYLKAMEAADEEARQAWLEDHARQVRSHIDGLSRKAYWDQFQPTPEFVFMFLPGEALLAAALQQDSTLLDYAVTKRVIPATPLTLIALLRAVAYGWQQEKIAENAEEISRIGRELYERINVVARHFAAVGRNLREAMDSFNKAVGSIESRLLVSARRLKDLGAGTGDDVPEIEPVDVVPRELQVNGESRLKTED
jgi:DNA recombination protein RmuC